MKDLLFRQEDTRNFLFFLDDLVNLKKSKFFCHTSFGFMDLLSSNPKLLATYNWNCALSDAFPSWVTVDCDGLVYPCDDFQIRPGKILLLDLFVRWDEFSNQSRQQVKERCPGCLWNTHIDAHAIKEGKLSFSDYVHRGDI